MIVNNRHTNFLGLPAGDENFVVSADGADSMSLADFSFYVADAPPVEFNLTNPTFTPSFTDVISPNVWDLPQSFGDEVYSPFDAIVDFDVMAAGPTNDENPIVTDFVPITTTRIKGEQEPEIEPVAEFYDPYWELPREGGGILPPDGSIVEITTTRLPTRVMDAGADFVVPRQTLAPIFTPENFMGPLPLDYFSIPDALPELPPIQLAPVIPTAPAPAPSFLYPPPAAPISTPVVVTEQQIVFDKAIVRSVNDGLTVYEYAADGSLIRNRRAKQSDVSTSSFGNPYRDGEEVYAAVYGQGIPPEMHGYLTTSGLNPNYVFYTDGGGIYARSKIDSDYRVFPATNYLIRYFKIPFSVAQAPVTVTKPVTPAPSPAPAGGGGGPGGGSAVPPTQIPGAVEEKSVNWWPLALLAIAALAGQ